MSTQPSITADDFCHFVAEASRNAAVQGFADFPEPGGARNFLLERMADNADAIIRTRQLAVECSACP